MFMRTDKVIDDYQRKYLKPEQGRKSNHTVSSENVEATDGYH